MTKEIGSSPKQHMTKGDRLRAPLAVILPSIIPVVLEKGVPGYLGAPVIAEGERKLSAAEIRPILAAAAYLGALNYIGSKGFDPDRAKAVLDRSLNDVSVLTLSERDRVLELCRQFMSFRIIRAEHPFDDWICESWWTAYQDAPYRYPSQMSNAVSFGLDQQKILERCDLEGSASATSEDAPTDAK
jgi:hypothetical protein